LVGGGSACTPESASGAEHGSVATGEDNVCSGETASVVAAEAVEPFHLMNLDNHTLSHVLSFLNGQALGRLACMCEVCALAPCSV
jgi:hypothetical protein